MVERCLFPSRPVRERGQLRLLPSTPREASAPAGPEAGETLAFEGDTMPKLSNGLSN